MAAQSKIQMAMKNSLFKIPHCCTLSALARNFTASASSIKPRTTFTSVRQPPDLGMDCSQFGNIAKRAKGNPSARPKPAAPTVNGHAPWSATPVNKVPRIGPVQEKETIASVNAIKNIPPQLPIPDLESIFPAKPGGKFISNKPKKDSAKIKNIRKKRIFRGTFVDMLLNISGLVFPAI